MAGGNLKHTRKSTISFSLFNELFNKEYKFELYINRHFYRNKKVGKYMSNVKNEVRLFYN